MARGLVYSIVCCQVCAVFAARRLIWPPEPDSLHNFTPFHTRYNDISPLENHHLSAALTLLREDQYAFMPNASKKVWRQPDSRFIMEESFVVFQ